MCGVSEGIVDNDGDPLGRLLVDGWNSEGLRLGCLLIVGSRLFNGCLLRVSVRGGTEGIVDCIGGPRGNILRDGWDPEGSSLSRLPVEGSDTLLLTDGCCLFDAEFGAVLIDCA